MNVHPITTRRGADLEKVGAIALFAVCGLITWAALAWSPLAVVAGLYVLLYGAVAWRWPWFAQILIVAAAPFQQDVGGGGTVLFSVAEVNLTVYSVVIGLRLLTGRGKLVIGPVIWPVLIYLLICTFSAITHFRGNTSIISILQMVLYMVVGISVFASASRSAKDHLPCLWALVIVCTLMSAAALVAGYRMMGLNKNGLGASFAMGLLVATELWYSQKQRVLRQLLLILLMVLTVGLFFSLSRGAWICALVGIAMIIFLRRRLSLLLTLILVATPILVTAWYFLPAEQREYAVGFEDSRYNIRMRYQSLSFAWDQFLADPLNGQGVGLRKEYDATNIVVTTLAETGVPGCLAFALIHVVLLRWLWSTRRRIPENSPAFSLVVISGALIFGRLAHGMVDHYWSRGAVSVAWASVGMAAGAVAAEVRQRKAIRV